MISLTKFKKLMTCYFVLLFLGFVLYFTFHESDNSKVVRHWDEHIERDMPSLSEENGSNGQIDSEQEALMERLDSQLREIASRNDDSMGSLEREPSDEEIEAMKDALHYALPTHALGLEDVWPNSTAPATPDYFFRSIAFTQDYAPTDGAAEGATPLPPMGGDNEVNGSDVIPHYDLDRMDGFYADSLAYYDTGEEMEIPHIIHQTWTTAKVPRDVSEWVQSWSENHPFWMHWFWTEDGFRDMVSRHFREESSTYEHTTSEVSRADMRKFMLVYKEGGVVADLDVAALRPLDESLLDKQCILAREPEVHRELIYNNVFVDMVTPAFMACRPGHPFFKFVLANLHRLSQEQEQTGDNSLNSAGTIFLSSSLYEYRKSQPKPKDDVYVAPPDLFFTAFDPSQVTQFKVKCNGYKLDISLSPNQRATCEFLTYANFNNTHNARGYAEQHWLRSSYHGVELYPEMDLITNIEPSITVFDR